MKKLLVFTLICLSLSTISLARDNSFNEKRDIVKNLETGNHYCKVCDKEFTPEELEKHIEFHKELELEEKKGN